MRFASLSKMCTRCGTVPVSFRTVNAGRTCCSCGTAANTVCCGLRAMVTSLHQHDGMRAEHAPLAPLSLPLHAVARGIHRPRCHKVFHLHVDTAQDVHAQELGVDEVALVDGADLVIDHGDAI